jgi:hypothetical protein
MQMLYLRLASVRAGNRFTSSLLMSTPPRSNLCCAYSYDSSVLLRVMDWIRSYGTRLLYAYDTYGVKDGLTNAIAYWESARAYTISTDEASSGQSSVKNFTLSNTCSRGKTIATDCI